MEKCKGPAGPRLSWRHGEGGTTIVPSFRFSKADDEIVEITPTSSFEEIEEGYENNSINHIHQDVSLIAESQSEENVDYSFVDKVIINNRWPTPVIENDHMDGSYRTGDD